MTMHKPISRAPRGVARKPVYLRLMPDERATLEMLANEAGQSLSSMARTIFLRGAAMAKPTEISRSGEEI